MIGLNITIQSGHAPVKPMKRNLNKDLLYTYRKQSNLVTTGVDTKVVQLQLVT